MIKKILLVSLLFFVPAISVNASQVYVQIEITKASGPAAQSFSLPAGTQMSILDAYDNVVASTTTEENAAVGDTLYFPLANLNSNAEYTISLTVPLCYGGIVNNNICWIKGVAGIDCITACSNADLSHPSTDPDLSINTSCCSGVDTNCAASAALKGSACSSCSDSPKPYYSTSGDNACYNGSLNVGGAECNCNWLMLSNDTNVPLCPCTIDGTVYDESILKNGTFNFPPFTAS